MKELTKEDLLNAVATYNADPYCVENEEMAEELYNDIRGNYEEIKDLSEAIDAAEKLDIKPYMQVRRIYEFDGGYFALDSDICLNHAETLAFSKKQWSALQKIEPDIDLIQYDDLVIIANIANRWFASYKIKNWQINTLVDLGSAIVADKIEVDEIESLCEAKGWIYCDDREQTIDGDIAIDLIPKRGEILKMVDIDRFVIVENKREIKYNDDWVNVSEDWQNYYIEFQDGDSEGTYPKDSFTLRQALDTQLYFKKEDFYSDDDREKAEEEIAQKVLERYDCLGADLYLYYDGDGGFSNIEISTTKDNMKKFADYFNKHEEEFASNIKVSDFNLDDEDDREEFADIVRESIREYATEVAGDYDYMWGTIEED